MSEEDITNQSLKVLSSLLEKVQSFAGGENVKDLNEEARDLLRDSISNSHLLLARLHEIKSKEF